MSGEGREGDAARLRHQAATRPGDPTVRARLATVTEGDEATRAAEDAVRLARTCLDAGVVPAAREAAELLIAWAPEVAAHAALVIDVALRGGDAAGIARAAEVAARWVARAPDSADARLRAALIAATNGEPEAVSAWLAPVLETSIAARVLDAQARIAAGDPRGALATLGANGLATRPEADLLEVAGVAWLEVGEPGRALDAFAAALAERPQRASIGYNMAVAFARAGSLGAAIGACDTALEWARAAGAGRVDSGAAEEARIDALRQALKARLADGLAQGESSA